MGSTQKLRIIGLATYNIDDIIYLVIHHTILKRVTWTPKPCNEWSIKGQNEDNNINTRVTPLLNFWTSLAPPQPYTEPHLWCPIGQNGSFWLDTLTLRQPRFALMLYREQHLRGIWGPVSATPIEERKMQRILLGPIWTIKPNFNHQSISYLQYSHHLKNLQLKNLDFSLGLNVTSKHLYNFQTK